MDGWIFFVAIALQGALAFHWWAREYHWHWKRIALAIGLFTICCIAIGAYPEIWPQSRGTFTPNRVCAALGYMLVFGCAALVGAYKGQVAMANHYRDRAINPPRKNSSN